MDLKVDPRYTLIAWQGNRPRHEACRYFQVLIGLSAKTEFWRPNGIGVSLDRKTNWKAFLLEAIRSSSFFRMDPDLEFLISLKIIVIFFCIRIEKVGRQTLFQIATIFD
jgi:hypothetical protein